MTLPIIGFSCPPFPGVCGIIRIREKLYRIVIGIPCHPEPSISRLLERPSADFAGPGHVLFTPNPCFWTFCRGCRRQEHNQACPRTGIPRRCAKISQSGVGSAGKRIPERPFRLAEGTRRRQACRRRRTLLSVSPRCKLHASGSTQQSFQSRLSGTKQTARLCQHGPLWPRPHRNPIIARGKNMLDSWFQRGSAD